MRALCIAVLLTPAACGYRVVQGASPFGAHRIAVVPFQENEPVGVAAEITDQLSRLLASEGVDLTLTERDADGILVGEVTASSTNPAPIGSAGTVSSYRVTLAVGATLRGADGSTLWSGSVRVVEDFLPSEDAGNDSALATESNRRRALLRLAERAAQRLHEELVLASSLREG